MIECLTPWGLILNLFFNQSAQCSEIYFSTPPNDSISFIEYAPYFLKTILLEFPLYYLFLKNIRSLKEILLMGLILNLATHPIIFLVMPPLLNTLQFSYLNYLIIAETFAPVVEALILSLFYKLSWRRSLLAALTANIVSWTIGVYWV